MPDSPTTTAARVRSTIGWGLFCASSWTWCIGMFLPAVLLHRYGWPGFLAFAIPNVIGCGAFGYVVRTAARSRDLVTRHDRAMTVFSLVTIAYHLYFIAFIALTCLPTIMDRPWLALVLAGAVFGIGLVATDLPWGVWVPMAVGVYAISIGAFVATGIEPLGAIAGSGTHPPVDLIWLTPTLVFGFALCPYLDRTFHRAIQSSPGPHAFAVFAGSFAVMLLLTCAYAGQFGGILGGVVVAHLFAQSIFTVAVHGRAIRDSGGWKRRPRLRGLILVPLLAAPLALLVVRPDVNPLTDGAYIRFLVFYGLVFPAYVLVFMGARPRGATARRTWIALGVVLLASMPCYELGFLHGMPYLLAAPLVVLIGLAWRLKATAGSGGVVY